MFVSDAIRGSESESLVQTRAKAKEPSQFVDTFHHLLLLQSQPVLTHCIHYGLNRWSCTQIRRQSFSKGARNIPVPRCRPRKSARLSALARHGERPIPQTVLLVFGSLSLVALLLSLSLYRHGPLGFPTFVQRIRSACLNGPWASIKPDGCFQGAGILSTVLVHMRVVIVPHGGVTLISSVALPFSRLSRLGSTFLSSPARS
jgi:hypothetical protein